VDPRELMAVFAGGVVGGLARVGLDQALASGGPGWPWATFAVNVAGAAVLGWVSTRLLERLPLSAYRRPLLGTGLCGALTTFSTLQLEVLTMFDAGRDGLALGYVAGSLAAGYAAVHLASAASRRTRMLA
jgi:CrcB protein